MSLGAKFLNRNGLSLFALPLLACLPVACAGSSAGDEDGQATDPSLGSNVAVVATESTSNVPTFIQGTLGLTSNVAADATLDVETLLPKLAATLHAAGAFRLTSKTADTTGGVHFRYAQSLHGLEVIGGDLAVHVRGGQIYAANGNVRTDVKAATEAQISVEAAGTTAAASYDGQDAKVNLEGDATLAYWKTADSSDLTLVHKLTVRGEDSDGEIFDTVLVDAVKGDVVAKIPRIMTAKVREIRDAAQSTSSTGSVKRTEGGAESTDGAVNACYDNLGAVYDTYKALYNRDSIDGRGLKLVGSVHAQFSTPTGPTKNNASWDPNAQVMRYGDGDGTTFSNLAYSVDVTGHELTHGVTSSTSNLTYSGQSGGLNEGWSDIFGAVIQWYHDGKKVSDSVWTVGEDVYTPGKAGDALRYMNNPTKDGKSIDYAPDYANQNVHYTSGVPNLAFYLASQGGKHPRGKTTTNVTGVGIEKAAHVFYIANTVYMTSSTNYSQAKTACAKAAKDVGLTAAETQSIADAWTAVGVK